jgi:hypothetical protein
MIEMLLRCIFFAPAAAGAKGWSMAHRVEHGATPESMV